MKMKRMYYLLIAFCAVGFIGCVNDTEVEGPGAGGGEGEDTYAVLKVRTLTRGAQDQEAGVGDENKLNLPLTLVVFDATTGALENTYYNIEFDGATTKTKPFKLKSGDKYIYVFSKPNTPTNLVQIKNTREQFEKQILNADLQLVNGRMIPNNLARPDQFLIGTLWGKIINVPKGGTTANPKDIGQINIGRVAAKIRFEDVKKGDNSPLLGQFDVDNAVYRICSVPTESYLVGQYEGPNEPGFNSPNVVVKSAVHEEGWSNTAGNGQNPKFMNYQWANALKLYNKDSSPTKAPGFYVVENTTKTVGADLEQYYGNTTYAQLKIAYDPDIRELYSPSDINTHVSTKILDQGTFYTANVPGRGTMIFDQMPTELNSKWMESGQVYTIKTYTKGMMTYSIPIKDDNEDEDEMKYTVLRNHLYTLNVTEINNLGDTDEKEIKPEIPIDKDMPVVVTINVMDWAWVKQGVKL